MEELATMVTIMLKVIGMGVLLVFGLVMVAVIVFLIAGIRNYFRDNGKEDKNHGIDS